VGGLSCLVTPGGRICPLVVLFKATFLNVLFSGSFARPTCCDDQVSSVHLNHWRLDRRLGVGLLFLYSIFLLSSILFGQM